MGNWRKMLWRLWIVVTVPWTLFMGFFMVLNGPEMVSNGLEAVVGFVLVALVPLVILALGRCIVWAIDGLRE